MQIKNNAIFEMKLKKIKKFFRGMVVSKTSPSAMHPCIKEVIFISGIDPSHSAFSSRPITRRVAELPSLRYGSVGAKTCTTGPLRVSNNEKFAVGRFCSSDKTKPPRRVRFTLPATDGPASTGATADGVAESTAAAAAGDGWLRTRAAPFSSKRSDAARRIPESAVGSPAPLCITTTTTIASNQNNHFPVKSYSSRRRSVIADFFSTSGTSVPVTASPGARNRVHPTGRYIKGTLSPTSNASPHATASPGGQALLRAARDGDDLVLRDLLRRAVLAGISEHDLNAVDCSGRTALSYMVSNGISADLLQQILQLPNINPNKPDNEGNTPLHFAAQAGQVECLNCLLSRCREIEIDARNNLGFTALMKAALQGRNKCAKLLLFAGANPTLRDNGRGFRADQWARFCGRYVCADVIEKHARQRLLERSTSYGNWGGEIEIGARVVMGKVVPVPPVRQQPSNGLKSKLKRVFRTSSTLGRNSTQEDAYSSARLVTQLTSAALCASSPVLPSGPTVPPVVKSLIRPLTVPKLQITLVNNNEDHPNQNFSKTSPSSSSTTPSTPTVVSVVEQVPVIKPARMKKKK